MLDKMSGNALLNFTSPYAKRLLIENRPAIAVEIDNYDDKNIPTYTTHDSLHGRINIAVPRAMAFDAVHITLEGSTRTILENLTPGAGDTRTTAYHNFLKLAMPMCSSLYPESKVFEPGQIYTFPFHFVIPSRLLPTSCKHDCVADHVRQEHLALPPSMGTRLDGCDDMSPEMTKITYAIKGKVVTYTPGVRRANVLGEGVKTIKVIPAVPEAPPLSVGADDREYVFTKSKVMKKGLFKSKLGTITIDGTQPQAIILPSPSESQTASTVTQLDLIFQPADDTAKPPRLGTLSSKLRGTTFFSAKPTQVIPTGRSTTGMNLLAGTYAHSVILSTRCVEAVEWVRHELPPCATRRDSGYSSISESDDSQSSQPDNGRPRQPRFYYKANVLVPLSLPQTKTFLPTFHSCLASRIYCLDMTLSIHSPGASPTTYLAIRLPVQIASAGRTAEELELLRDEAAEADEFLRPRTLSIPDESYTMSSTLATNPEQTRQRLSLYMTPEVVEADLPPGYEALPGRHLVQATAI